MVSLPYEIKNFVFNVLAIVGFHIQDRGPCRDLRWPDASEDLRPQLSQLLPHGSSLQQHQAAARVKGFDRKILFGSSTHSRMEKPARGAKRNCVRSPHWIHVETLRQFAQEGSHWLKLLSSQFSKKKKKIDGLNKNIIYFLLKTLYSERLIGLNSISTNCHWYCKFFGPSTST